MAHNICINEETGKASVFVVKDPAWHNLGQVVDNALTAEEAIIQAGLDFEVNKRPLIYMGEDGVTMNPIANKSAMVRSDNQKCLGIVGNNYTPIQNKDAFCFFDNLVNRSEAIYHTAGALGQGEKIWILAKLPTDIVVGKDDLIKNYVLIYNSHDGSAAVTALLTPTRVVCNNTLTSALQGATNKVTVRHSINAEQNLKEAHKFFGLSNIYRKELEAQLNLMAQKQLTQSLADKMLSNIFDVYKDGELIEKSSRIKTTILDIYNSEVGGQEMDVCKGTAYGLYNAITFFQDNVSRYKNENLRMKQTYFGNPSAVRQKAFEESMKLAVA